MRLASRRSLGAALALGLLHCGQDDAGREIARDTDRIVENRPGTLVVTSPARAVFIEGQGEAVEVRGTGATASVTVNGAAARVSDDGSFVAKVKPVVGLNVIEVVDGDARLETPFLYGQFEPANEAIPHAVTVEIGSEGLGAPAPNASVSTVVNRVLEGRNLVASLAGQTFSGEMSLASWKYQVTGGHNGDTLVDLGTAPKGIGIRAEGHDVVVEGNLTIRSLGIDYTRATRVLIDLAQISGDGEISLTNGVIGAAMPDTHIRLDGFRWDAGNFGFPCCVDSIVGGYIRPKIEDALKTGIREAVPGAVKLTLEGAGLPKELDLSMIGLKKPIPVAAKLDDGAFDGRGTFLSASLLFGGTFAAGTPGAAAPGFLRLAPAMNSTLHPPSLGASISLDAVNQLLFAAWGTGDLAFSAPAPIALTLTPKLPPMLSITKDGAVRIAVGEVVVQKTGAPTPLAAISILQDVQPSAEGGALMLGSKGKPRVSITWLADGTAASGADMIANAAEEQITKLLTMRMPLPAMGLDKLGAGFAGQSLGVKTLAIGVDAKAARLNASGSMTLLR